MFASSHRLVSGDQTTQHDRRHKADRYRVKVSTQRLTSCEVLSRTYVDVVTPSFDVENLGLYQFRFRWKPACIWYRIKYKILDEYRKRKH